MGYERFGSNLALIVNQQTQSAIFLWIIYHSIYPGAQTNLFQDAGQWDFRLAPNILALKLQLKTS